MSSPPPPPPPPKPLNTHLLPTSKNDDAAIAHLATLDPSEWTYLILYNTPTPASPRAPPIDFHTDGLLTWLQDLNWPIAQSISTLLLSLVNGAGEVRDTHGQVLVDALKRLFAESEDWGWLGNVLFLIVTRIEDKTWVRETLGGVLKEFGMRVSPAAEEDHEFAESIAECLGESEECIGKVGK